ncbi:MAG: potassium-transporting ATPase subunit KdpB, partial [Terrimicrobiaceae bacterium]
MAAKTHSIFDLAIVVPAIAESFKKLNPLHMVKNPVMFVTEIGAAVTTVLMFTGNQGAPWGFLLQITLWLWFTVLFANFAEAMAEGRGKAQADSLRKARTQTFANRVKGNTTEQVSAEALRKGDLVIVKAAEFIPGDGEIIEGAATVDESAITGESAPVVREAGGDRSAVTGGTRVLSDVVKIRITSNPGETFLDRMIGLVEGAKRQRTPNEIALTILLSALTLIFLVVLMALKAYGIYQNVDFSTTVLVALLVCLIPTTIGGLLSAIGIAGIDRLVQKNVLAMSGRAVEAAGDVDVLLLDKTGTITLGNRQATALIPAPGVTKEELAETAQLASLADETPEGRSIVILTKEKFGLRGRELHELPHAKFVPFTAQTRMSGVDLDGNAYRKGSVEAIRTHMGGNLPEAVERDARAVSEMGATPLLVANQVRILGTIQLKDIVKGGLADRFERFRAIGIRTVMITGDNPLTAAAIAKESGVDDFLAEAKPEDKLALIRKEQAGGRMVAMTGDGTNDAPALAQADVGVAMNTGTQAAKEAGNMVDLDSNPTKLLEIVEIGKQLLITRGALTTFSIANDVAKYFAIIPAMLLGTFPQIAPLNVMGLATPQSAILS